MKVKKIDVVSNTHWDREFRFSFEKTRHNLLVMMDTTLDILESDKDYHSFTMDGHSIMIDDYLQMRPERKEQVEKFIREGRLIIGPYYTLPEEFTISHEALIRNLMKGRETVEKFGVKAVAAMSAPTALYDDSVSNLRDVHDLFTGCDTKEEMERTSPITYAKKGVPPTLLAAGTSDYLVFSTSSEKLYEKLIEAGAECELVLSVCGSHSFEKIHKDIEPSLSQSDVQDIITEFILKHI